MCVSAHKFFVSLDFLWRTVKCCTFPECIPALRAEWVGDLNAAKQEEVGQMKHKIKQINWRARNQQSRKVVQTVVDEDARAFLDTKQSAAKKEALIMRHTGLCGNHKQGSADPNRNNETVEMCYMDLLSQTVSYCKVTTRSSMEQAQSEAFYVILTSWCKTVSNISILGSKVTVLFARGSTFLQASLISLPFHNTKAWQETSWVTA